MRNMIRRVERLEETIGRAAEQTTASAHTLVFIDRDGSVASSLILEPGKPNRWIEGAKDKGVAQVLP
jgi:hypothetical protein